MKTHTPGPWVACKPTDALHAVRAPSKHNGLGMIICDAGYGATEEINLANAALIAAAPDLLAALEKIAAADTGKDGCFYTNRNNIHIARSAISFMKAK